MCVYSHNNVSFLFLTDQRKEDIANVFELRGKNATVLHGEHGTWHSFRTVFVFLIKDEVIALHPFVSLSFIQRAGVSLIDEHHPNSPRFVIPGDGNIHPTLPILLIAFQYISPSAKANETEGGLLLFLVPDSSPMWTRLTVGLSHDCPKQSNPGCGGCILKWGCTDHHHHYNLERPSPAERRESRGPPSHRCADSAPC